MSCSSRHRRFVVQGRALENCLRLDFPDEFLEGSVDGRIEKWLRRGILPEKVDKYAGGIRSNAERSLNHKRRPHRNTSPIEVERRSDIPSLWVRICCYSRSV